MTLFVFIIEPDIFCAFQGVVICAQADYLVYYPIDQPMV